MKKRIRVRGRKSNKDRLSFEISSVQPTDVAERFTVKELEADLAALESVDPNSIETLIPHWRLLALAALRERSVALDALPDEAHDIPEDFMKALSSSTIAQCFAMCADQLEDFLFDEGNNG